jgi:hypothetical protein
MDWILKTLRSRAIQEAVAAFLAALAAALGRRDRTAQ